MSNQETLLSKHSEDKSQNDNPMHSMKDTLKIKQSNSKAENNFSGISQRKKMP
jgi:hypothetical protein